MQAPVGSSRFSLKYPVLIKVQVCFYGARSRLPNGGNLPLLFPMDGLVVQKRFNVFGSRVTFRGVGGAR